VQFLIGRRERGAREDDATDRVHIGDLGKLRRATPTVDRQRQRASHARIVKRLFLVVGLDQAAAIPVAFLDSDLAAERADKFVADRRRKPTELDRCAAPQPELPACRHRSRQKPSR